MLVIDFSAIGVMKEQPILILKNADGTPIQTLGYAFNLKADIRYNEVSTITFDLPAYVDGDKTPHYDDVIGMRVIDMRGWGQFILVNPEVNNNGVKEIKRCKAYSLEYELTYKQTYFEEATYNFWNPLAPDNTVLGLLLADSPSWSVGSVDEELIGRYRTFSEESANVYNFMKSTAQKTFNCIFDFDTYERKIYVKSANSGTTTKPVHISMNNLAKEIEIEEDTESIVTALEVNGGEDVDIRMVNPMGTNKIYNLDYFMNSSHFQDGMIAAWNSWKRNYESARPAFYNLSVEQALKTSAILTEKAKLSEIEDAQLGALLSERTVYVEYLAQIANQSSSEYQRYQSLLDEVNANIAAKQSEADAQKGIISALEAESEEILEEMKAIKNAVSFSNFFSDSELLTLKRYFKEDSIEGSSFVLTTVDSYDVESDISNDISNIRFLFTGGTVARALGVSGKSLYTVSGGKLVCTGASSSINASVVSASLERADSDGSFTLAVYLNAGVIGSTEFPGGCISFTGTCLSPSSDVVQISNTDDYATGTRLEFTSGDGRLYFTRNTTEYEKYSVEWDLYEYGRQCLDALAYPSYTFSVSSANFFMAEEFESFVNEIELGKRIYLNTESEVLEPICIGVSIDFENMSSMSVLFSDKYSASDKAFKLVDLLDNSISMGKTLNSNKLSYSAFVDSGASTAVKKFMNAALDVAKNSVLSSTGQGISWDETGLHLRKYLEDNPDNGFEDEQIWMINNAIVFTDDGWQTAKMAIGKIIDENLISDDNPSGTAYGIVAPYIVGTLLAGQNLIIDTENGGFRVDASGVYIDALRFYITHGGSVYDRTLEDELDELSSEDIRISDAMQRAVDALNERVDGTVTTYYQDNEPDNPNVGDLWFDTSDDKLYRFGDDYTWTPIEDAGITEAIEAAQSAQSTADGKISTYYQAGNPARSWSDEEKAKNVGDIWYNTSSATVDGCGSKKAFRWNGTRWQSLEDGSIPDLERSVASHSATLSSIINENGYLKASELSGVINTLSTQMQSGSGNVLFDGNGLWLMNGTTKSSSTKAIWMNENGILLGGGDRTDSPETEWTWTTAIGHDGITAEALASKTLSAVTIKGGSISIGGTASNPAFKVDTAGNLTANTGTFRGTLESPSLRGKLNADGDTWLIGAGLSVGGNPTEYSGNFRVDTDGNVTMKGSIDMSQGTIRWGSGNSPVKVQYSVNGASWHNTFTSSDIYARYSYDGGSSWTTAIQIQGKDGKNGTDGSDGADGRDGTNGRDGSDANVTFANVNSALSNLFKTWSGGTPASMSSAYIYSPDIKGGNIYGANIYAGTGSGFTAMNEGGLNVYDPEGNNKIGLGYYSGKYTYPYLSLGVGSGTYTADAGLVMKFGRGLWIGTSNVVSRAGDYPPNTNGTTGIFINFNAGVVSKYINGVATEIGGSTAVFG